MTQGERIREVRKALNLTLEKFGGKLGVGKTAISKLEKDENNLTEQMTKAICREFHVDYIWLTTGEGEMFLDSDDDSRNKLIRSWQVRRTHERIFLNLCLLLVKMTWKQCSV